MPRSDVDILGESVSAWAIAFVVRRNWTHLKSRLRFPIFVLLSLLSCSPGAAAIPAPEEWVPIRWTGGPMELARRTQSKTVSPDPAIRDALAHWYEPATLSLLEKSPANCLLVTWSAPVDAAVEAEQQRLVKVYADAAHKRGLAVLGLVYAAGEASKIAADAGRAALDGLVLEGEFSQEFPNELRKAAGAMLVIEIASDAAQLRWRPTPIIAIAGVAPSGRNLSEMGIRGAPSSEPWIESNIWLVRSFSLASARSVWISSELENPSVIDYERAVADAAAAGGRWIVSLDDALRAKLRGRDDSAQEIWRHLSSYLKFAESPIAWHDLAPFGNVGIVIDPARANEDPPDEYLKLAARRQVPYKLISRSGLNASSLAKFRALVATGLDPTSADEHKMLQQFAENGGIVIAGSSWGGAQKNEPFTEIPVGKGRVIVYRDPAPDTLARDLKELLSDEDLGVVPFNVPSVITFACGGVSGEPLRIQLVNYFDHPVEMITLRVAGKFRSARLETPEGAAVDLHLREDQGTTEVTIPKLSLWGAVSIE